MAARVYRVGISPDGADHVTRVLLLDGRASLHDLHVELGRAFGLPPTKAAYAFFTSGRAWDESTMFTDPRAVGRPADKALLFRLGLSEGKELAYVLGFEVERHFRIRVLGVTDAERPLPSPVLVESEGELRVEDSEQRKDPPALDDDEAPPELRALLPLAEQLLTRLEELEPHEEQLAAARAHSDRWDEIPGSLDELKALSAAPPSASLAELGPVFRAAGEAALRLVRELGQDLTRFAQLDEWLLGDALGPRLLDLPLSLSLTEETDLALELCRELTFIDPDLCGGDAAVILARAGRRAEALAQVEQNLAAARDEALAESKAGDVHRALGDNAAAEAYYRRSLTVSKAPSDRLHAVMRLAACLMDVGRDAEASELLAREGARGKPTRGAPSAGYEGVGRNDPCPCGSGKKFKKCHGV